MKKNTVRVIFALLFTALWVTAGSAAPFDQMVVFGDSLSDDGNLVFFEDQPRPDPLLYFEGRFSNGPVWVEYLADAQHLNLPETNLALGGAQTGYELVPPGLNHQVNVYLAESGFSLSGETLFVIWIGGNDFLNGNGDFQEAVDFIEEAMENLVRFGAMHLLVLNLPDLGAIPDTLDGTAAEQAAATRFTLDFNTALAAMLDSFRIAHPALAVYTFDVYSFFAAIRQDPAGFGFVNATEPSPNFDDPGNFDGAGYVFWDDKHPTTATHALLADMVFADLNEQFQPPEGGDGDSTSEGGDDDSTCFIGVVWR